MNIQSDTWKKLFDNFYFKLIAGFVSCIIVLILIFIFNNYYSENVSATIRKILNSLVLISTFLFVIYANKKWNGLSVRDIGLSIKIIPSGVILGTIYVVVIFSITLYISYILNKGGYFIIHNIDTYNKSIVISILINYFIVGFYEEIFFRAYLLNSLLKKQKVLTSVLISSVIFSLIHLPLIGWNFLWALIIFFISIMVSYIYLFSGNLWIVIFFHFIWNSVLQFLKDEISFLGVMSISTDLYNIFEIVLNYVIIIIALIILFVSLKYKPKFPYSKIKE